MTTKTPKNGTTREKLFSVTLKDCEVDTFRAGGPGGQNQNKRDTAVRIKHPPSGAVGESREHRTQLENKKAAFRRMADSGMFRAWVARQSHTYKEIERRAAAWAQEQIDNPANLRTEVQIQGRWVSG